MKKKSSLVTACGLFCGITLASAVGISDTTCPYYQATDFAWSRNPEKSGYFQASQSLLFCKFYQSAKPSPLVIMIPGMPVMKYFDVLAKELTDNGFDVLEIELPGKSESFLASTTKASESNIAAQMQELLTWLQVKRDYSQWHVFGTSMGSSVAMTIALNNFENTRSVVIESMVALPHHWTTMQKMALVPVTDDLGAYFSLKSQVEKDVKDAVICPQNFPALLAREQTELSSPSTRFQYLNIVQNLGMADHTATVKNFIQNKIPTLVIYGSPQFDPFAEQTTQLKQLTYGSENIQYTEIQGTSHISFIEKPLETSKVILDYLQRVR